jgi:hypothetical protein
MHQEHARTNPWSRTLIHRNDRMDTIQSVTVHNLCIPGRVRAQSLTFCAQSWERYGAVNPQQGIGLGRRDEASSILLPLIHCNKAEVQEEASKNISLSPMGNLQKFLLSGKRLSARVGTEQCDGWPCIKSFPPKFRLPRLQPTLIDSLFNHLQYGRKRQCSVRVSC